MSTKEQVETVLAAAIRQVFDLTHQDPEYEPLLKELKLTYWRFSTGDPNLSERDLVANLIPMKEPKGIFFNPWSSQAQ